MGVTLYNPCCNMQSCWVPEAMRRCLKICSRTGHGFEFAPHWSVKLFESVQMDRIVVKSGMGRKNEEVKKMSLRYLMFSLGAIFAVILDYRKVPWIWSFFWCHRIWFQNPLRTNFQSSNIKSGITRPPPWGNDFRYPPGVLKSYSRVPCL